ncbi:PaaI family thioesterase [Metabacillus herbersteinensis]|uniref:PaaI family thioesterase n=1 Tax=Metabacillus herbersteinensis TaxID=283816 RepID=A0ABV6GNI4_9BACI
MNEKLLALTTELIEKATDEEKETLHLLLQGFQRKQEQKNGSYIGALLHAEGEFKDNQFVLKIPNTPLIQNALDIVHGGITATMLDSAMGSVVHHLLPPEKAAVTTEIKVNYVAPGIGKELTCVASIIHHGSKTMVTEGKVFRDDGKLIAHSTASFFIIDRKQ